MCLRRPTFSLMRESRQRAHIRASALMYPVGSWTPSFYKLFGYCVSPCSASLSGPQGPSSGQTSYSSLPSAMKAHSFRCPSSPHETRPLRGLGFRGGPMRKAWLSNATSYANLWSGAVKAVRPLSQRSADSSPFRGAFALASPERRGGPAKGGDGGVENCRRRNSTTQT